MNNVHILGTPISTLDLNATMHQMESMVHSGKKARLCVIPVNCLVWARENRELQGVYHSSAMNLADGVPLLWASRLLGRPIAGRVTGLDLLPEMAARCASTGMTFFLLGAKDGVAEQLARRLKERHPELRIVGWYSPPFRERFSIEETEEMIHRINAVKPNFLWVSFTAPKQDFWIYENLERLQVNVAIGVGGAFEVTAGLISRAPLWMQRFGLEWFFRFLQEPKRLFHRYFIEAPVFIPLVLHQVIKQRLQSRA